MDTETSLPYGSLRINTMQIEGAVIREQGQTFAVVIVKLHIVQDRNSAAKMIEGVTPTFGVPVVLMAQDNRGKATYYGRPDIARFMAKVPIRAVPWKKYTIR